MQAAGGGMGWLSVAPLLFIFAIFYFLLIMPQQRRQKKWTAMLDSLKTGDKVKLQLTPYDLSVGRILVETKI